MAIVDAVTSKNADRITGDLTNPLRGIIRSFARKALLFCTEDRFRAQAIKTLDANDANPDECEWAERYLSGMTRVDLGTFTNSLLCQS